MPNNVIVLQNRFSFFYCWGELFFQEDYVQPLDCLLDGSNRLLSWRWGEVDAQAWRFSPSLHSLQESFFLSSFFWLLECFLASSCQSPGGNAPAAYRSHSARRVNAAQSCGPKRGHLAQVNSCQVSAPQSSPDDQAAASSCIASVVVQTRVHIPQVPQSIKVSAWYFMCQHGAASQYKPNAFVRLCGRLLTVKICVCVCLSRDDKHVTEQLRLD